MSMPLSDWLPTRNLPLAKCLVSGLVFEVIWLVCVLNPSTPLVVVSTAANLVLHSLLFHGLSSTGWRSALQSLIWVTLVMLAGIGMDAVFFKSGTFVANPLPEVVPIWLACLWLNFALAVRFAFVFLHGRLWLSSLFGLIGGPVSYLIGAKIGGEVSLAEPLWFTMALLALAWSIFLPMMVFSLQYFPSNRTASE